MISELLLQRMSHVSLTRTAVLTWLNDQIEFCIFSQVFLREQDKRSDWILHEFLTLSAYHWHCIPKNKNWKKHNYIFFFAFLAIIQLSSWSTSWLASCALTSGVRRETECNGNDSLTCGVVPVCLESTIEVSNRLQYLLKINRSDDQNSAHRSPPLI